MSRSLYEHLKLEAQPRVLDADKARSACILNGLKNDSSCKLTGEKSLEIHEVYAEKVVVDVFVNQQNSIYSI